jgi:precorrin-2 methylase
MSSAAEAISRGALVVVGTGIGVGQITAEAQAWLGAADKVLYCVSDAATERLILKLNPDAESLYGCYGEGKRRRITYDEMVESILRHVREEKTVCAAFYGHPGVFVYPSHRAIELARKEGFSAKMLPAVSCIDCLFSDLGVDPSRGCQIFEASDLMLRKRALDTTCHVIILQVAALGDLAFSFRGYSERHTPTLGQHLSQYYSADFKIKSYDASQFSITDSVIREMTVGDLLLADTKGISTLYIPPVDYPAVHLEMLEKYELSDLLDGVRLVPINSQPGAEGT